MPLTARPRAKKPIVATKGNRVTISVQVFLMREGKQIAAYCPALELAAYGSSKAGAKRAFEAVVENFLGDTIHRGTLEQVLLKLGWSIVQLGERRFFPPLLSDVNFQKILRSHPEDVFTENVFVPSHAVA